MDDEFRGTMAEGEKRNHRCPTNGICLECKNTRTRDQRAGEMGTIVRKEWNNNSDLHLLSAHTLFTESIPVHTCGYGSP